jgi:hypothetical protein
MAFVLSQNRVGTARELEASFARYRAYLEQHRAAFPPSAFELASSDWYFSLSDPRAPHDGWLEDLEVSERGDAAQAERCVSIRLRLRNAQHNRYLDFVYPRVFEYHLDLDRGRAGHRDWRYDEFRLSDEGTVIHEIEWSGAGDVGRWLIVGSDVHLTHRPMHETV